MAEFYEDMAEFATTMIADFGRQMALVTETLSDDYIPTVTEHVEPVIGVETLRTVKDSAGLTVRTETWILLDSQVEPKSGMRVRDGGVGYSITEIAPKRPGPITTHYKVRINR